MLIESHANYYIQTMKRIINGYRFPEDINPEIYTVYSNFALSLLSIKGPKNCETVIDYLELMPTLNESWVDSNKESMEKIIGKLPKEVQKIKMNNLPKNIEDSKNYGSRPIEKSKSCYKCPDRHLGCHSSCDMYKTEHLNSEKRMRRKIESEWTDYEHVRQVRIIRKKRNQGYI